MRSLLSLVLSVACLVPAVAHAQDEGSSTSGDATFEDSPRSSAGPASGGAATGADESDTPRTSAKWEKPRTSEKKEEVVTGPLAIVVVPKDPGANEAAALLEQALTRAAETDGRLQALDLIELLGGEPTVAAKPDVEEHFRKGKEAYDNLDLGVAAEEYLAGLKILLEDPVRVRPSTVARALTLAGAAHLLNGETDKAAGAFKRASMISPEYAPDAAEFSPDILTAYNDAKQQAANGAKGQLTVTSSVNPTEAVVDGASAGIAPVTLRDLPAGRHHVVVKSRGHRPWGAFVEVPEGGTGTASADLRPLPEADRFRKGVEIATTELNQRSPGIGAKEIGAALKARFVILGVAKTAAGASGSAVELVAYDLTTDRRASGVKKTVLPGSPTFKADTQTLAQQLIDSLVKPTTLVVAEEGPTVPITQRAWFWPVVGGVGAAVVAGAVVGIVAAAAGPEKITSPTLITTGIP